jgi:surface carbohydrate biosynthesis protein
MNASKGNLLLPVENQVRELDARLLLACVAAKRGFTSVIGPIREIEARIASFPQSIYLSKSMLSGRIEIFKIMRRLGLKIVTLDEEALVHLPAEIYYSRRLSPDAMSYVSRLFAWGQDNAELWRQYPHRPNNVKIHVTGNPRNDMLRPEIRSIYEGTVQDLHRQYGEYILVNTNFNHVNAFYASMNLFKPQRNQGDKPEFGRAARGMTRAYAEGLRKHKQSVFEDFQALIPKLDEALPGHTIIVRPHPTENQQVYQQIAAQCENVQVTNEGNVVPWLMGARALIHNGCTTGVEAYVMGVPAISYRATIDPDYDDGFFLLPNCLSHQCFNFEELNKMLSDILSGVLGVGGGVERKTLIDRYLAAQDGPLACERIIGACEDMLVEEGGFDAINIRDRIVGGIKANRRARRKQTKSKRSGSHLKSDFQRHRYPDISTEKIQSRLSRFQNILEDDNRLQVKRAFGHSFRINSIGLTAT